VWVALLVVSPRLHRGKLGGGHSSSQGGHFRRLKCYPWRSGTVTGRFPIVRDRLPRRGTRVKGDRPPGASGPQP